MIRLRISRDDAFKQRYMSYVATTTGNELITLVFNSDESKELMDKIASWIERHPITSAITLFDRRAPYNYSEDLVIAIQSKGRDKRVGTLIVTVEKDHRFAVSKVSFDDQVVPSEEYDLVLNDITVLVYNSNFI